MPKCDFNKFITLLCNLIEITHRYGCSPVNLLHIFKIPFIMCTSRGLLLYQTVALKKLQYSQETSVTESFLLALHLHFYQKLEFCYSLLMIKVFRTTICQNASQRMLLTFCGILITIYIQENLRLLPINQFFSNLNLAEKSKKISVKFLLVSSVKSSVFLSILQLSLIRCSLTVFNCSQYLSFYC